MSNPLIHYIADGSNFDGQANNAAYTSGGLFTFDAGLPDGVWVAIRKISLDIEGTTPVLTDATWDVIDRTVGVLPYDGQTANFTAAKTLTGGTSGATATIVNDDDAGTAGDLLLSGIAEGTGPFEDGETITDDNGTPGSATANCQASGSVPAGVRFKRERVDVSSALQYTRTFGEFELVLGPEASGSNVQALRLVTQGMTTSFGVATVYYEYFRARH